MRLIVLLCIFLTVFGCNSTAENSSKTKKPEKSEQDIKVSNDFVSDKKEEIKVAKIDTLNIIVLPSANGYEYEMGGFNFNPVIEKELNKFENINIRQFPFKKLTGVAYHGIFDKKYCSVIIEKVDVDYLILTRFSQGYVLSNTVDRNWGYEVRIVNTNTMEQINSISAKNFNEYEQMEQHIRDHINQLRSAIEKL